MRFSPVPAAKRQWLTPGNMESPFNKTITFLHTDDLERTAQFYEEILELPLVRDQGVCRIYKTSADSYLGFCTHLETPVSKSIILTLVISSVDAWYETLLAKGVEIVNPPSHNPKYQIYHFFFKDPNGYTLEIQHFDEALA
mgnify:FL=1